MPLNFESSFSLTCEQENHVCGILFRNIFSRRAIYVRSLHTDKDWFFNTISKMFCNVSLQLTMTKRRQGIFSALVPETEEQIKLAKGKIRFDF